MERIDVVIIDAITESFKKQLFVCTSLSHCNYILLLLKTNTLITLLCQILEYIFVCKYDYSLLTVLAFHFVQRQSFILDVSQYPK